MVQLISTMPAAIGKAKAAQRNTVSCAPETGGAAVIAIQAHSEEMPMPFIWTVRRDNTLYER